MLMIDCNRVTEAGKLFYNIEFFLWVAGFAPSNYSSVLVHICVFITIGVQEGNHMGRNNFVLWLGPSKSSNTNVEEVHWLQN